MFDFHKQINITTYTQKQSSQNNRINVKSTKHSTIKHELVIRDMTWCPHLPETGCAVPSL